MSTNILHALQILITPSYKVGIKRGEEMNLEFSILFILTFSAVLKVNHDQPHVYGGD